MAEQRRILLSVPHMGGSEEGFTHQAFASNWISTVGPHVSALEAEMQTRIGLHAVALSSGTAAIHLGLRLLGVGQGDRVFCSTLTFVASANPIRYLGAEPVFLDSDRATWNMDPARLEAALRQSAAEGKLPKAVVVVDLYGQCADYDAIREICTAYRVPILEDAAEALGATYKGNAAGTLGDVGVFSFNGNKIITTSGGGMLMARNAAWVEKARHWSNQARNAGLGYQHAELGYNYRMSNVLAGIGRGQLQVLDRRVEQRRAIAFRYREAFADLHGIGLMPQAPYGVHTNWLSCFLIDERAFGVSRDGLIEALDAANVEARPVWKPMHLQPLYQGCVSFGGEVAEDLSLRGICLPSSSSLTDEEQARVIDCIRKAAGAGAPRPTRSTQSLALHQNDAQVEQRSIEDLLLGRVSADIDRERIRGLLQDRVVLVTGAGGSIGSELCRQIAAFGPVAIVGFEIAESALFEVDAEMRAAFPLVPFYAEIGSIQNRQRVEEVLGRHRPSLIYHAAAYKHVPLMEEHAFEAVENNVFGTCNVAEAAAAIGADKFVMISSDKAVRPSSVMGATKRIAELLLLGLRNGRTSYLSVRFGNVIGSSGSVIPIFRRQIAAGGPVTVTDPEMSRYFIPLIEACRLVLQASAMEGGGICVLDMGHPVKIVDLARSLIRQAGLRPEIDIPIEFTGIRAGEKLSEELFVMQEGTAPTGHNRIRVVTGGADTDDILAWIDSLRSVCRERDLGRLMDAMQAMATDYTPSAALRQRAIEQHPCPSNT